MEQIIDTEERRQAFLKKRELEKELEREKLKSIELLKDIPVIEELEKRGGLDKIRRIPTLDKSDMDKNPLPKDSYM